MSVSLIYVLHLAGSGWPGPRFKRQWRSFPNAFPVAVRPKSWLSSVGDLCVAELWMATFFKFLKYRDLVFWGRGGPMGPGNSSNKWGAKPPTQNYQSCVVLFPFI